MSRVWAIQNIGTGLLTSLGSLSEIIKKLLDRNVELINKADAQGWTPLHYAAYCRNTDVVSELLKKDNSIGYTRATVKHDNGMALHIAAAKDHDDVMGEILTHCPDCWEMVNNKRKNIFHIAVDREAHNVIGYIIERGWLQSLMNKKDVDGDTPLHLLASSKMDKKKIINHPRANMYAVNNQNKTPAEVAMSIKEDTTSSWRSRPHSWRNIASNGEHKAKTTADFLMKREREESTEVEASNEHEEHKALNKSSKYHMLVATLVATITFAAGFAIPGGYEITQGPNEGMAVLVGKAGFKAFILANTIAVVCSTSSALVYAFATLYDGDDVKKGDHYMRAFTLILVGIIAMTVGFLSGTYAMLVHSLGLAIATSSIAGISFLIYFYEIIGFVRYHYKKIDP
ncbi:hypothetical protein Vadar_028985 [Vaccinium darrowii]|uniref:Uncharacterized protein n=1 Tax=Vaccinium darrowii TaxID=229202 RepID=A0ACB7YZS5_9ERIC|nr:hypothetical protein Vadar_028985 [Vaccinium darrowii]